MGKEPILTSIIFTYNHGNTIEKCIKGMLEQKTTYDFEIQIWDDCSIDNTSEVCKKYAELYPDKIKYYRQEQNTFTLPYRKMQAYKAIRNIKSKYWCMMDGDDWWCDENKVQIAIDFLENNQEYVGFAHDTNYVDNTGIKSYVHDMLKVNPPEKIKFVVGAPFLLISSRIFRTLDYAKIDVLPIDYQMYWYHLSKGPIYYCDRKMATYNVSPKSTFAYSPDLKLCLMQPYKILQITNYEKDVFCTDLLLNKLQEFNYSKALYYKLLVFKRLFGVKQGWKIWFFTTFVRKYGLESMNLSFIYSDKDKTRNNSDTLAKLFEIVDQDQSQTCITIFNMLQEKEKKIKRYKKYSKIFMYLFIFALLIIAALLLKGVTL